MPLYTREGARSEATVVSSGRPDSFYVKKKKKKQDGKLLPDLGVVESLYYSPRKQVNNMGDLCACCANPLRNRKSKRADRLDLCPFKISELEKLQKQAAHKNERLFVASGVLIYWDSCGITNKIRPLSVNRCNCK